MRRTNRCCCPTGFTGCTACRWQRRCADVVTPRSLAWPSSRARTTSSPTFRARSGWTARRANCVASNTPMCAHRSRSRSAVLAASWTSDAIGAVRGTCRRGISACRAGARPPWTRTAWPSRDSPTWEGSRSRLANAPRSRRRRCARSRAVCSTRFRSAICPVPRCESPHWAAKRRLIFSDATGSTRWRSASGIWRLSMCRWRGLGGCRCGALPISWTCSRPTFRWPCRHLPRSGSDCVRRSRCLKGAADSCLVSCAIPLARRRRTRPLSSPGSSRRVIRRYRYALSQILPAATSPVWEPVSA